MPELTPDTPVCCVAAPLSLAREDDPLDVEALHGDQHSRNPHRPMIRQGRLYGDVPRQQRIQARLQGLMAAIQNWLDHEGAACGCEYCTNLRGTSFTLELVRRNMECDLS